MAKLKAKPTQCQKIVAFVQEYGGITSRDAYKHLGVTQLGSRIFEMEHKGYTVDRERITVKDREGDPVSVVRYFNIRAPKKRWRNE